MRNKYISVGIKLLIIILLNIVVNCNFLLLNVFYLFFTAAIYFSKLKVNDEILSNTYLLLFFIWSVIETCLSL